MSDLWAAFAVVSMVLGGCAPLGLVQPGTPQAPEVLRVTLTDASLDVWPRLVARGRVGVEIVNDGRLEHGIEIVGPGVDERSEELLVSGQRRLVWLELPAGTFRVFCPDGDHAKRGLAGQLVVTERASWFRR